MPISPTTSSSLSQPLLKRTKSIRLLHLPLLHVLARASNPIITCPQTRSTSCTRPPRRRHMPPVAQAAEATPHTAPGPTAPRPARSSLPPANVTHATSAIAPLRVCTTVDDTMKPCTPHHRCCTSVGSVGKTLVVLIHSNATLTMVVMRCLDRVFLFFFFFFLFFRSLSLILWCARNLA
jgi:hypothetical protein